MTQAEADLILLLITLTNETRVLPKAVEDLVYDVIAERNASAAADVAALRVAQAALRAAEARLQTQRPDLLEAAVGRRNG